MDLFKGFLTQILSSAGVIFIFGLMIALLRRGFCALCGRAGPRILLATGIIGTPIHELSHALMCIIFGHKITEIKLYQPSSRDGTLGYVSHSYNRRNIYHQIGNFFIGIAPILLGSGMLLLLMYWLMPETAEVITNEIMMFSIPADYDIPVADYFKTVIDSVMAIFSAQTFSSFKGWAFVILAVMISTHMEMSLQDIKSSLKGLLFISVLLLLADGVLYLLFPELFYAFNELIFSFGLMLSAFLSLSLIFLAAILLVALLVRGIMLIFGR